MKLRSGFVSNSSSSSFICIGYLIDHGDKSMEDYIRLIYDQETIDKYEDIWELNYEEEIGVWDHDEDGAPPGKIMIGKRIDVGYDSDIEVIAVKDLQEAIDKPLVDLDLGDLQIITGTRMC